MANPFVGEIRIFGFGFAPMGWAFCDGQSLPISQNSALFSILGIFYGGDGKSTFALPNLQGATPVGFGQGQQSIFDIGETGGAANVTLLESEMPAHTHAPAAYDATGDKADPTGSVWAQAKVGRQGNPLYSATGGTGPLMAGNAAQPIGGNLPHNNMSPYLTLNFCIALQGVFPPRS